MGYRYCPECDEWYATGDYTVDDTGETVCKVDGHGAVHGFIINPPWSEREFLREHPSWYGDREPMLTAARRKGLVE